MRLYVRYAVLLVATATCIAIFAADNEDVKAANDAAQQWLALVDQARYGQSWDEASSYFRQKVTKEQWVQMVTKERGPRGKVESRQFKLAELKTDVPDAPPGKYMVMQYRTKFSDAGAMIETITPMLDKDGKWKISGYVIKPE